MVLSLKRRMPRFPDSKGDLQKLRYMVDCKPGGRVEDKIDLSHVNVGHDEVGSVR